MDYSENKFAVSDDGYTPIIIVGAARSGTNALRDMMVQLPDFASWDCDEINPIWRHGNAAYPNDEFVPSMARARIKRYVRNSFRKIWFQNGKPKFIVEKTCANSLRVLFVNAIFPEAKFVYIVRNGFDVIASAQKRWEGEFEHRRLPYFLKKARYAPLSDIPHLFYAFVKKRVDRILNGGKKFSTWGPRINDTSVPGCTNLTEVCARQWARSVSQSDLAFRKISSERVVKIYYEKFVADPQETLDQILSFINTDAIHEDKVQATRFINAVSVGKGKQNTSAEVKGIMVKQLSDHNYL